VSGLLVLVGGPLLVLALWYSRGRDPEVGVYADYLPQPPSDLPPGIVGTLIDEKVDMHDVVSTIVDLARRGYIIINEEKRDHIYIRTDESTKNLRAYEVLLLQKLFGKKKERKLSDLRYNFSSALPALHAAMYKELEAEGFVPVSPQAVRTRYGCFTGIAVIVGSALVFVPGILTGADLAFCIGLGFLPTILALAVAGRHMPRKTELGALEASKWVAFKNYLNHIEDYTDLKEATAIFDRYLPYAVAFGLQTSWINKFSRIDTTPIPTWYGPIGYPRPIHMGGGSRPMTAGTGGSVSMPSLEGMSQSMTGGLEGMSKGLTRMLTSTSTILESTRSTSSSTGGSGGFSGGFSGGSSGGGSRGFG
jgi:uncharacterized membrane protein